MSDSVPQAFRSGGGGLMRALVYASAALAVAVLAAVVALVSGWRGRS